MSEPFDVKKLLAGLNIFDSVTWSKALSVGIRIALALGLFTLVKTAVGRPRVSQPITITNPSGPVTIGTSQDRKWVMTGMASDRALGVTVGAEFGGRFHYGVGAEWDRDEERLRPLIVGQLRF